eukprot:15996166-Heterocapsa_arctica.AAC.1
MARRIRLFEPEWDLSGLARLGTGATLGFVLGGSVRDPLGNGLRELAAVCLSQGGHMAFDFAGS